MDITYVVKKGPKQYLTTFDSGRKADRWGPKGIDFIGDKARQIAHELARKYDARVVRLVPKGLTWGVRVFLDSTANREDTLAECYKNQNVRAIRPAFSDPYLPLVDFCLFKNSEARIRAVVEGFRKVPGVKSAFAELIEIPTNDVYAVIRGGNLI